MKLIITEKNIGSFNMYCKQFQSHIQLGNNPNILILEETASDFGRDTIYFKEEVNLVRYKIRK